MAWRDRYRAASFRGVSFYVEQTESDHGRRQAVHEHAQRDTPYTEDMGRKAREFSITGYVLGSNYDELRDQLIEACETAGPGQLIHPYRGEMTVVCRGLKVAETSTDGGFCRLSMVFLEAGKASFPSESIDRVNAISSAGNKLTAEAERGFVSEFLTEGFPAFVLDSASTRLAEFGEFLSDPGFSLTSDMKAASDFYLRSRQLVADATDLVRKPLAMVSRVTSLMSSVRSVLGGSSFSMLTGLFDSYASSFDGATATPSRKQQSRNVNSFNSLIRLVALSEAAKSVVVTETVTSAGGFTATVSEGKVYSSYQEAITARDSLVDRIDAESESTPSDAVFNILSELRTTVVQSVPSPDQDLPHLVPYTPRTTQPSLLLAYQIYGDAGRADEIATRNNPRHPGFLIGGKELEVLADG